MDRRSLLATGVALLAFPLHAVADKEVKAVTYKGKVISLADWSAKSGAKLDDDVAKTTLVFVTEDDKAYVLLKNSESRLFFSDTALLNRPMQVSAKFLPGSQVLRLLDVQSVKNGKLCEVYYWCTVCSIRRGEKLVCECCGGPMELREVLIK